MYIYYIFIITLIFLYIFEIIIKNLYLVKRQDIIKTFALQV